MCWGLGVVYAACADERYLKNLLHHEYLLIGSKPVIRICVAVIVLQPFY